MKAGAVNPLGKLQLLAGTRGEVLAESGAKVGREVGFGTG